jgi:outer membrane protein OmpA-like peptidoglycan-associated protein
MHWVGKQVTTRGLDAHGLTSLLANEGQKVSGHLPAGFSSMFKGGGVIEGARERFGEARSGTREPIEATHATRERTSEWPRDVNQRRSRTLEEPREHHPQRVDRGMNPRWLWLPLVALGLVLLWWGFRRPGREHQARLTAPEVNVTRPAPPQQQPQPQPVTPPPTPPAPTAAAAPTAAPPPAGQGNERQPVAGKDVTVLSNDARPLSEFFDGNAPVPQRFVLEGVQFDTGSSHLAANPMLDETARILRDHPNAKVRVEGHTDREGTGANNRALSQQRADAVKNYLVRKGVKTGQLTAAGMSELNPIADNGTAEGRADNRRVELIITQR